MQSISRSKRRLRESPSLQGQAPAATATDQGMTAQSRKTLQLSVPQSSSAAPKYYPGTSIPLNGWFHACKVCRCWTAFSTSSITGAAIPLCRRCASHSVKDRSIKSIKDSDTADAVTCIPASASGDHTQSVLQPHPAFAAAPASLTDCQSPAAPSAAPTSAQPHQASHGLLGQYSTPGNLQHMHATSQHTTAKSASAPTCPNQPTAASTGFTGMESIAEIPHTLPEVFSYASLQQHMHPAWQQQQQWIPQEWSQDLNAEPQCKSRRCSDVGPDRIRSAPQRPLFHSQGGWGNSAPSTTRPAAAQATLDNNSLLTSAGGSQMELHEAAMVTFQTAASAGGAGTIVPGQQIYQEYEPPLQQQQLIADAFAGSLLGHWGCGAQANESSWSQQQQPVAASYQAIQQMPYYQPLVDQQMTDQYHYQQQVTMGDQNLYHQHMPQQQSRW